jgi:ATP synthase protein I
MNRPIKSILQLLVTELAALGLLVLLVWIIQPSWTASAVAGGLVFVLPNTYFTLYALSSVGIYRERWFLNAFYRGQSGKWILTAAGFAIAFKFVQPLHSMVMLLTFCAVMLVHLIVMARVCGALNPVPVRNDTNLD